MKASDLLSIAQVARRLDVTEQTVKNWVLWFERTGGETGRELPFCTWVQKGSRKCRYYRACDVKLFRVFKKRKLKRWGLMADFNANRSWGAYGKDLLERKKRGLKYARQKTKISGNAG